MSPLDAFLQRLFSGELRDKLISPLIDIEEKLLEGSPESDASLVDCSLAGDLSGASMSSEDPVRLVESIGSGIVDRLGQPGGQLANRFKDLVHESRVQYQFIVHDPTAFTDTLVGLGQAQLRRDSGSMGSPASLQILGPADDSPGMSVDWVRVFPKLEVATGSLSLIWLWDVVRLESVTTCGLSTGFSALSGP